MTEFGRNNSVIEWERAEKISIPSPDLERRIAIRYIDWSRCKRKIMRIKAPIPRLHLVYSGLFGISASSVLSIITHSGSENISPWILPLYSCIFFFSLVCAIVFVIVDLKLRERRKSDLEELSEDMNEIESTFVKKRE